MKNKGKFDGRKTPIPQPCRLHAVGLSLAILFAATATLFASTAQEQMFAERARAAYEHARAEYQSQTNNPVVAWEFARTCYDLTDRGTNKSQDAAIAQEGINACQRALLLTNCAALHYYMGLNLGQLAQYEMLHGLHIVHEMEREWLAAAQLDQRFDFAGPNRSLGLLYRDAPGWPLSIGNRDKAEEFLQSAAVLAPDDPENILNLAETYLKWGDTTNARHELKILEDLWPKAQKNLAGERWAYDWYDWSRRRDAVRQKLNPAKGP
jgi:tetratricopeptide (TPR) repeat protein